MRKMRFFLQETIFMPEGRGNTGFLELKNKALDSKVTTIPEK